MNNLNPLTLVHGLAAIALVAAVSGCGLLKSDKETDAEKAAQALAAASANASVIPAAPKFVLGETPTASATVAEAKPPSPAPQSATVNAATTHATGGRVGVVQSGQTTAAKTTSPPTTMAIAASTGSPTTLTAATVALATTNPTASTVAASTPTTVRRRASIFSGNPLFSGGGGTTGNRGNRAVVAPTREGAQ